MKIRIIAATAAIALLAQPAVAMESPISEPVFQTKTSSVVLKTANAKAIKKAVGKTAISVDCQAGISPDLNAKQLRAANALAKRVCNLAKKAAPSSTITQSTFEATGSQLGRVKLTVVSNDIPKDFPKVDFGVSVGALIGFGMYLLNFSIPKKPKAGGSAANPATVTGEFYLCPTALPKAKKDHYLASTWADCTPKEDMQLGVDYRVLRVDQGNYIRIVLKSTNALGTASKVEEFEVK